MEEVKRTVRIVWLNNEGKKRLWSLNNIDPRATATSIMEITDALGALSPPDKLLVCSS